MRCKVSCGKQPGSDPSAEAATSRLDPGHWQNHPTFSSVVAGKKLLGKTGKMAVMAWCEDQQQKSS